MKLIESKVEVIEQQPGLEGVYKQTELAGRTCYKSEDKITEDSAKEFVDRMIKSKHGAMLEHGTVYLKGRAVYDDNGILEVPKNLFPDFFERNKPLLQNKDVIFVDAVINSGKGILKAIELSNIPRNRIKIVTNVLCDKAINTFKDYELFTVRVSHNSFRGEKVAKQADGIGPDTGDRLFKTLLLQ